MSLPTEEISIDLFWNSNYFSASIFASFLGYSHSSLPDFIIIMDVFSLFLTDLYVNGTTKLVTTNVTKLFQKFNAIVKDYYVTAKSTPQY